MIEGLAEVRRALEERGINMVIRHVSPEVGALELSRNASMVIVDRGYLRTQRKWYIRVAERCNRPLIQVESNVVIPTETASYREEYAAATFRPKIKKLLNHYLIPLGKRTLKRHSMGN